MFPSRLRPIAAPLALSAVLALVAGSTLTPTGAERVPADWRCLVCGPAGGADIVANVLLFVPVGAALRSCGLRGVPAVLVGVAASVGVELLQAAGIPGRAPTLSDVLFNTVGTVLGALIAGRFRRWMRPMPGLARQLVAGVLVLWLGVAALATWLLGRDVPVTAVHPLPSGGVKAPSFGWYGGEVLAARVDDWSGAADGPGSGPVVVRATVGRIATAAAHLRGGDTGGRVVPFLYVHDDADRVQLSLAQSGPDLAVTVRRRATTWRLREPAFRLPGALAAVFHRGSRAEAFVAVRLAGDTIAATVIDGARARRDVTAVAPTVVWSLVVPGVRVNGPERLPLTAAYLACCFVPLGYWTRWAARGGRRVGWVVGGAGAGAVVGLTVIPAVGAVSGATLTEWGIAGTLATLGWAAGTVAARTPARRE